MLNKLNMNTTSCVLIFRHSLTKADEKQLNDYSDTQSLQMHVCNEYILNRSIFVSFFFQCKKSFHLIYNVHEKFFFLPCSCNQALFTKTFPYVVKSFFCGSRWFLCNNCALKTFLWSIKAFVYLLYLCIFSLKLL